MHKNDGWPNISKHNKASVETGEDELFRYVWDPLMNSWIIGNENFEQPNAVIGGMFNCPTNLNIPRVFPHLGKNYPIETIGSGAFGSCGNFGTNTTSIFIPKEVKILRAFAFNNAFNIINFTIEPGSKLEIIEGMALSHINYRGADRNFYEEIDPRKTLVFPSTLSSFYPGSITNSDLFTRIIYCGTHNLNINSTGFEYYSPPTRVYAIFEYMKKNSNSIFGRQITTNEISDHRIQLICEKFENPKNEQCVCSAKNLNKTRIWVLMLLIISFQSETEHCCE